MSKWTGIGLIIVLCLAVITLGGYIYITYFNDGSLFFATPLENPIATSTSPTEETPAVIEEEPIEEPVYEPEPVVTVAATSTVTTPPPAASPAWKVFEQWLTAVKTKNLETLKLLTYEDVPCNTSSECNDMFNFLKDFVGNPKEATYVNVWEDGKQIILTSNARSTYSEQGMGYERDYMFFVKVKGEIKVLMIEPRRTWFYTTQYVSVDKAEQELQKMIVDTDKDGLTDSEEKCEGANQANPDCKQTDPTKRDSDGDGWWDGVEAKFIII